MHDTSPVEAAEFPSLLSIDPVREAEAAHAEVREHLLEAIGAMRKLSRLTAAEQQSIQAHLRQLEDTLSFIENLDHMGEISSSPLPERWQHLGETLKQRRQALKLSVERLAKRSGLSAGTIKKVERGEKPSRTTLLHLANVAELELNVSDLLYAPEPEERTDKALNCYIAPGFDPVKMVIELGKQLNGPGGYIEQTNAYLDHQSVAAYLTMANEPGYVAAFRACFPVEQLAQKVMESLGHAGLDLIGLGSGDAQEEVRLVQHLAGLSRQPDLRLYLLDISQPMLSVGFKHAADHLHDQYGIAYFAMQANFHHLPLYTQLHYTPRRSHRRRLVCMLGRTMANLEDEPRFFRHSLVGCAPNDLLLLDMQLTYASASQPMDILRKDPAFNAPFKTPAAEWLASPIIRHCKGVSDVLFKMELKTQCPIPGSYELDAVATVKLLGRQEKKFSMFRWRRYDPEQLHACLHGLGWERVADFRYGSAKAPAAAMLFKKRALPTT